MILTAMDCEDAVRMLSSLSETQEGRGTAMLVGRLEACTTWREDMESSVAEYLL